MNTLVAQERKDLKRSALKELRNGGEIPAVVYGSDIDTKSISVKNADFLKVMKGVGRNGIISLNIDGEAKDVMLRDYQDNTLTRDILHVDFLQVDQHTEIDTKVSVVLKGTSIGEKAGGVVKQILHELDVTAAAINIPDNIEIDITDFEIGHTVRVGDIKKEYKNCTFKHEDEEAIVMVEYVKVVEEEEASEVEA